VIALLEDNRQKLEQLCRDYSVSRLEAFGSATDASFDPERSDIDFLVEFHRSSTMNSFHQFFGFQIALAELFHRNVDLVDAQAVRNPYFIESINRSRQLLYAA